MRVIDVVQYGQGPQGQGGLFALVQQYFLLLVLLIGVPLLVVAYRLLFPNLNAIHATRPLRPEVEMQRAHEDADRHGLPEQRAEDVPSAVERTAAEPAEAEAAVSDAIGLALRLLRPDERKVVEALLNAEGSMLQKDITHETGFSRVKTHRVLARLLQRDVVVSEKHYNTNRITLAPWIREEL
jgi:hypothetical protein